MSKVYKKIKIENQKNIFIEYSWEFYSFRKLGNNN